MRIHPLPILFLLAGLHAQEPAVPPASRAVALPLAFEPTADPGCFIAQGRGYAARVGPTGIRLALRGHRLGTQTTMGIEFIGAAPACMGAGEDPLPGRSNRYLGGDPSRWRTGVPQFGRVRFSDLLPGVDVVCYGNQRRLEYDLVVAPGVDPARIELRMQGVDAIDLSEHGDLLLTIGGEILTQHAPVLHQQNAGRRVAVAGRYELRGERGVGFSVGDYDPRQPLIIDPVIAYGTYLGGSSAELATGLAVDGAGNKYVTGITASANFPSPGAPTPIRGLYDIFVARIDPTGSQLLYSTILGGTGAAYTDYEWPHGIGVDGAGRVVVLGMTINADFPVLNAAQGTLAGGWDAVVFQLDATGALSWSTFLGGSSDELQWIGGGGGSGNQAPGGIAVDPAGHATVVGATWSVDFPTLAAMQPVHRGGVTDGFVTRYDPAGQIVYSTFLGGSGYEEIRDAVRTPQGLVAITGESRSTDFPVTPGAYSTQARGFVTLFDAAAQAIVRSTLFPVSPHAVAVDQTGDVYVAGASRGGVPTTPGAFMTVHGGSVGSHWNQGFAVKLDANLANVLYGTYYGSNTDDEVFEDIAVDAAGQLLIGGTSSSHFTSPAIFRAIALKLNPTASNFPWVVQVGNSSDHGYAVALGAPGQMYFVGQTRALNGIATAGAMQPVHGGSTDGFLVRIDDSATRVDGLTLAIDRLTGNTSTTGTVALDAAAPAGGVTVALTCSNPSAAAVPATVIVPAGAASASFPVSGAPVPAAVVLTITASWNGARSAGLRVWPGPSYGIVPIFAPGDPSSDANAINGFGDVVGTRVDAVGSFRFFRFDHASGIQTLGTGTGQAVNDRDQVAGSNGQAFRYTPGTGLVNLGALTLFAASEGYSINNLGQVAGRSDWLDPLGMSAGRAFRFTDGVGMVNLGALGDASAAGGINNAGEVVGSTHVAGTTSSHAFRYTDGTGMVDLGTLPGHVHSSGQAINERSQVAGRSFAAAYSSSRGFLFTDGLGMVELSTLPSDGHAGANDLNHFGHVVGWSHSMNAPSNGRAVRWLGSSSAEALEELLSSADAAAWDLRTARGINDRGEIAGTGAFQGNSGRPTAFRLGPLSFAPYGRGCPGTGGRVPGLTGVGYPVAGNTVQILLSGRPISLAVIVGGFTAGQVPVLGCELLVGGPLFDSGLVVLDATGTISLSVPLPAALPPGRFFLQGFGLDAGASNGLAASQGLEVVVPY